jgi:hypothetical protein
MCEVEVGFSEDLKLQGKFVSRSSTGYKYSDKSNCCEFDNGPIRIRINKQTPWP